MAPSSPPRPSVVTATFGRRELNFAETRLALLEAAMDLAREGGLVTVPVDEIARRAGVSRMTFFNRFPEKDALWLYFAWTWWFEDTVVQRLEPLGGFAGIERIFRRVAEAPSREMRFFRGFAGYMIRMGESRRLDDVTLTPAEMVLLHPGVPDTAAIPPLPLHHQLRGFLKTAVLGGELPGDADLPALVTDLVAALYGEILLGTVTGARDLWPRYRRQLDRIAGWETLSTSAASAPR